MSTNTTGSAVKNIKALEDGNGDGEGPSSGSAVYSIGDGRLVIEGLEISDRKTVEVIERQSDPEAAVRMAIQIGVRAIEIADGSLDTKTVEDRFDGMSNNLEKQLISFSTEISQSAEKAGEAFTTVAESLIDEEEGSLVKSLEAFKAGFLEEIDDLFDEDSKESLISKFEDAAVEVQAAYRKQVEEALAEQKRVMEKLIDPHDENGPIGRLNKSIGSGLKEVVDSVQEIKTQLTADEAAAAAAKEVHDNSAHKGVEFESILHQSAEAHVSPLGDSLEDMSLEPGVLGTKKGDFTVELNTSDTLGASVRYVLEAKDSKLSGPKAKEEIEAGMANRDAKVGLLVFAKQEYSPSSLAFKAHGDKAYVVLDRDTRDDSALRLALMWARWITIRELRDDEAEIDARRISELISRGSAAIKTITAIRTSHTKARNQLEKSLDQAGGHLDTLEEDLEAVFDQLEAEISRAETEAEDV